MNKTKIDWCDSTWNPVTGCLHGCEYCYARGIAQRFAGFDPEENGDWNMIQYKKDGDRLGIVNNAQHRTTDEKKISAPYPFGFIPTLHRYRLNDYINKKSRNIFVCSMADLFGDWVPDEWIDEVFKACEKAPQHNYLFLTKNVERYCRYGVPILGNMWYGVSVTRESETSLFNHLPAFCNTFVSFEPILEDLEPEKCNVMFRQVNWVIIGAETGRRKDKVIPKRDWIEQIVEDCRKYEIPLFMKSSLAEIWGESLIQEFPKELQKRG